MRREAQTHFASCGMPSKGLFQLAEFREWGRFACIVRLCPIQNNTSDASDDPRQLRSPNQPRWASGWSDSMVS
jgi:hypothetical protein